MLQVRPRLRNERTRAPAWRGGVQPWRWLAGVV